MIVNINTLKSWFTTGARPTQAQFWNWLESYWHKDENIPAGQIEGLQAALDGKANAEVLNNEIAERQQSDTALQAGIDAEAQTREQGDATLQANLTADIADAKAYTDQSVASVVNQSYGESYYFGVVGNAAIGTPAEMAAQYNLPESAALNYFDFATLTPYTATTDGGAWQANPVITPQNGEVIGISKAFLGIQEAGHPGKALYSSAKSDWDYFPDLYSAPDGETIRSRTSDGALEAFAVLEDQPSSPYLPEAGDGLVPAILQSFRNCLKYAGEVVESFTAQLTSLANTLTAHINSRTNPHGVTAAQVGADVSGAAASVQTNLNNHAANTTSHVTAAERSAWNNKMTLIVQTAEPASVEANTLVAVIS